MAFETSMKGSLTSTEDEKVDFDIHFVLGQVFGVPVLKISILPPERLKHFTDPKEIQDKENGTIYVVGESAIVNKIEEFN